MSCLQDDIKKYIYWKYLMKINYILIEFTFWSTTEKNCILFFMGLFVSQAAVGPKWRYRTI